MQKLYIYQDNNTWVEQKSNNNSSSGGSSEPSNPDNTYVWDGGSID